MAGGKTSQSQYTAADEAWVRMLINDILSERERHCAICRNPKPTDHLCASWRTTDHPVCPHMARSV